MTGSYLPVLLLLMVANGAPVIGRKLLGERFAWRLDGGQKLADGSDLLGPAKTVRGIVLSVAATAAVAPLVGVAWATGATLALFAMAGDAMSSFVKRRLGVPPSGQAFLLDQVPESLLPLAVCQSQLGLRFMDIAVLTLLFLVMQKLLSRILYHLHVRSRPY